MTEPEGLGETIRPPWQEAAACRGEDADLFFPGGHGAEFATQIAKAKAVCRRCPVRGACLDRALTSPERYGIWGGLDEQERGLLRRRTQRRASARRMRAAAHAERESA